MDKSDATALVPDLDRSMDEFTVTALRVKRERDELLAALEAMLAAFSLETDYGPDASAKRLDAKKRARAALAKARKE